MSQAKKSDVTST